MSARKMVYVGHQEEVNVPYGSTSLLFKRDEPRDCPEDLAKRMLGEDPAFSASPNFQEA